MYSDAKQPHILQSEHWLAFQRALGQTVVDGAGDGWLVKAVLEHGRISSHLYAPYGPVAESEQAVRNALSWLESEAKRLRAAAVRVEPTAPITSGLLSDLGYHRVAAVQPEYTQIVDVDRDFDSVLKEFATNRRRFHRNYYKKGVTVEQSQNPEDIEALITLLHKVKDRTGMHVPSNDYLKTKAEVFLSRGAGKIFKVLLEGEPIAAGLTYEDDRAAYYVHVAADDDHRRLSPNSILASSMVEDASNSGKKVFDFFGVVPADVTDHAWSNFSEFKRSFGGEQMAFIGTWEKPVNRMKYAAQNLVHKLSSRKK